MARQTRGLKSATPLTSGRFHFCRTILAGTAEAALMTRWRPSEGPAQVDSRGPTHSGGSGAFEPRSEAARATERDGFIGRQNAPTRATRRPALGGSGTALEWSGRWRWDWKWLLRRRWAKNWARLWTFRRRQGFSSGPRRRDSAASDL